MRRRLRPPRGLGARVLPCTPWLTPPHLQMPSLTLPGGAPGLTLRSPFTTPAWKQVFPRGLGPWAPVLWLVDD